MEVDKLAMMEMIHNVNFFPDQCFFHGMTNGDELGSKHMLCLQLTASVDNTKCSSSDLLQDLIVVIHAVLGLDLHRLGYVLCIDVEHKLVVIPDFTFLSANLLASFRVN